MKELEILGGFMNYRIIAPGNRLSLTRACLSSSCTFQNLSGPRLRIQQDNVKNTIILSRQLGPVRPLLLGNETTV